MWRWRPLFWIVSMVLVSATAFAQMPTTIKNSLIREENPKGAKERLVIPYAFSSETMGLTFGIGAMTKGYGQDQLLVAREYTLDALTSNWKADAGLGIRAMVAGGVVRFDVAASEEGFGFWFMVGQPF